MRELIEKAGVLQEALPYIRRFSGRTFVVKYGGHAMTEEALKRSFARDVALLKFVGIHPVVVHGGGPQIDATLKAMGVEPARVDGLRVTDDATMRVVEMVLCGDINGEITSLIADQGGRAVGLSGRDDRFLRAERMAPVRTKGGGVCDLGRVGEIKRVDTEIVTELVRSGFIPVIAPVAVDEAGAPLNVNADTVASHVAAAIGAEKLVLMTDVDGVRDGEGRLVSALDKATIERWLESGVISGGMIPKVRCALDAIATGVNKVHIVDGRIEHAILLEIFTDSGIGTEIVRGA